MNKLLFTSRRKAEKILFDQQQQQLRMQQQRQEKQQLEKQQLEKQQLEKQQLEKQQQDDSLAPVWLNYRLGDMIMTGFVFRNKDDYSNEAGHYRLYPNSIASKYMRQTKQDSDLPVLANIIKNHNSDSIPDKDMLVIHLRIGDAVERSPHLIEDFLKEKKLWPNGVGYVKPLSYYVPVAEYFKSRLKKVVLVGGGNNTDRYAKGKKYMNRVAQYFENKGFQVQIRMNQHPDDDFVFMCNSRYFIQGGGQFSRLIAKIVQYNIYDYAQTLVWDASGPHIY